MKLRPAAITTIQMNISNIRHYAKFLEALSLISPTTPIQCIWLTAFHIREESQRKCVIFLRSTQTDLNSQVKTLGPENMSSEYSTEVAGVLLLMPPSLKGTVRMQT